MSAVLPFLVGALLLATSAQLLLRSGLRARPAGRSVAGTLLFALCCPAVWVGSLAQALAMGFWLLVLRRAPIGLAYPVFIGGGMVLVTIASGLFLKERVTARRVVGGVLMIAGIGLALWE